MWSLSNAFTSAFKELEPIPQYKATARLAGFCKRPHLFNTLDRAAFDPMSPLFVVGLRKCLDS
jgi:hypothetical protein